MVCGHLLECRRAEILLAVELSPVEQHLRKSRIIGGGRDQPAAGRLPFRMVAPLALREEQYGIIGEGLCHARPLRLAVKDEFGAGHPERRQDAFLEELKQRFAGYDLDDPPENVGGMAVTPERTGLS